jgi:hypothetical protein
MTYPPLPPPVAQAVITNPNDSANAARFRKNIFFVTLISYPFNLKNIRSLYPSVQNRNSFYHL